MLPQLRENVNNPFSDYMRHLDKRKLVEFKCYSFLPIVERRVLSAVVARLDMQANSDRKLNNPIRDSAIATSGYIAEYTGTSIKTCERAIKSLRSKKILFTFRKRGKNQPRGVRVNLANISRMYNTHRKKNQSAYDERLLKQMEYCISQSESGIAFMLMEGESFEEAVRYAKSSNNYWTFGLGRGTNFRLSAFSEVYDSFIGDGGLPSKVKSDWTWKKFICWIKRRIVNLNDPNNVLDRSDLFIEE